jgi:hypothetical protein
LGGRNSPLLRLKPKILKLLLHLGQVSHVDQRAADIAIAEVLDLGPLGALAVDAGLHSDFGVGPQRARTPEMLSFVATPNKNPQAVARKFNTHERP